MTQRLWLTSLGAVILLLSLVRFVGAQDFTEDQVIDMVVGHAPFSYGLQTVPDWNAAAYDTHNAYGIWRVQFWNAEGEEIGWANIDPLKNRLYNYEGPFESTEEQKRAADPIVRKYIQSHPDVIELLGDPTLYNDQTYIGYNGWANAWGVWIGRQDDSLYLLVQFEGKTPDSLTNPTLIRIEFPEVLSYDEWFGTMGDQATAIAFTHPEIAAALRDVTGWTTAIERQSDGLWHITFLQDETEVVTALVNLDTREIVEWDSP